MNGFLAIEDLRPGDVLLSRGRGEISRWMAWNGESRYTHAAIVVDARHCVEAVVPVARRRALLRHVAAASELIDVYRPVRDAGAPLDVADRARIAHIAEAHIGRPFATARMLPLALRTLLHHKFGLALAPAAHRDGLTCTELVYRVLHEAIGMPAPHARRRERFPRPQLQPRRLWSEYLQYRRSATAGNPTARAVRRNAPHRRHMCSDVSPTRRNATPLEPPAHAEPFPQQAPSPNRSSSAAFRGDLLPGDLVGSAALAYLGRLR